VIAVCFRSKVDDVVHMKGGHEQWNTSPVETKIKTAACVHRALLAGSALLKVVP